MSLSARTPRTHSSRPHASMVHPKHSYLTETNIDPRQCAQQDGDDLLTFVALSARVMIIISGSPGAGKTSVLEHAVKSQRHRQVACFTVFGDGEVACLGRMVPNKNGLRGADRMSQVERQTWPRKLDQLPSNCKVLLADSCDARVTLHPNRIADAARHGFVPRAIVLNTGRPKCMTRCAVRQQASRGTAELTDYEQKYFSGYDANHARLLTQLASSCPVTHVNADAAARAVRGAVHRAIHGVSLARTVGCQTGVARQKEGERHEPVVIEGIKFEQSTTSWSVRKEARGATSMKCTTATPKPFGRKASDAGKARKKSPCSKRYRCSVCGMFKKGHVCRQFVPRRESDPARIGERVQAKWEDGWYYHGSVAKIGKGNRRLIKFDDGDSAWTAPDDVKLACNKCGTTRALKWSTRSPRTCVRCA